MALQGWGTAIRRGFARWLQLAVIVLPVWLFVGWGVWGGSAWGILGLAVLAPVAFVVLGIVALLVWSRPSVRAERAVTWRDVAVLGVWHLTIIAIGFYGSTGVAFTAVAVLASIAAFWYALLALMHDGVRAAKAQFDAGVAFERGAAGGGPVPPGPSSTGAAPPRGGAGGDDVIIVHEQRDDDRGQ